MADGTLTVRSPLADFASVGRFGKTTGAAGVTVQERIGRRMASVQARNGKAIEAAKMLSDLLGLRVGDAQTRVANADVAVVGTAPGQWLVTAQGAEAAAALEKLQRGASGLAAVAEQGDGRVVLEISGPSARATLAKGIALDLDPGVFKVGDAAQTLAGHLNVQLSLLDDGPTFELVAAASTAGSLWHWLSQAAAEFGGEFRRG